MAVDENGETDIEPLLVIVFSQLYEADVPQSSNQISEACGASEGDVEELCQGLIEIDFVRETRAGTYTVTELGGEFYERKIGEVRDKPPAQRHLWDGVQSIRNGGEHIYRAQRVFRDNQPLSIQLVIGLFITVGVGYLTTTFIQPLRKLLDSIISSITLVQIGVIGYGLLFGLLVAIFVLLVRDTGQNGEDGENSAQTDGGVDLKDKVDTTPSERTGGGAIAGIIIGGTLGLNWDIGGVIAGGIIGGIIGNWTESLLLSWILGGVQAESLLRDFGFREITTRSFGEGAVDPIHCWRRGFTFAEITTGIPISRQRVGETRTDLTQELLTDLENGGAVVLVGPPGTGKTTACKMAATEWFNQVENRHVLYRPSGTAPVTDPKALTEAIEKIAQNGEVLVVVDDAARHETVRLYETIHDLTRNPSVSFLLNASEREWENFEEIAAVHNEFDLTTPHNQSVLTTRVRDIQRREMPPLDQREVERIVQRFEEVTQSTVRISSETLFEQISKGGIVGSMTLLSYYLPVRGEQVEIEGWQSALEADVLETFNNVHGRFREPMAEAVKDEELFRKVALLINVMNAADLPLYPEYLYAVGTEEDDFVIIDQILTILDGRLLFGHHDGNQYQSHHPIWSEIYLQKYLETIEETWKAREEFTETVNALFELFDQPEQREAIRNHLTQDTSSFHLIENNPIELADEFVTRVFEVGEFRPILAPLFGTSQSSEIELPEHCSISVKIFPSLARFQMYLTQGEFEAAQTELEMVEKKVGESDSPQLASYHTALGELAHRKGDYGEANRHHQQSLDISREIEDFQGEANSLDDLGLVAQVKGDFDQAREYHQMSLEISRELDNRAGKASSLNNLGLVAWNVGHYEKAREYFQQSLEINRELGDRKGEARSLGNLGLVARAIGEFEQAQEYFHQSLKIHRKIGDRQGQANDFGNLGLVAANVGAYAKAREYHQQSLEIKRNLGDLRGQANSLGNLGLVAKELGDREQAEEYFEKSLDIIRDIGDRRGMAKSLNNLGVVARHRGDYEQAREYHQQSLEITQELGDRHDEAKSLSNLGAVAREQGDYEQALEYFEQCLDIEREFGDLSGEATSLSNLGSVTAEQNDHESAAEYFKQAASIYQELGALRDLLDAYENLARTHANQDEPEEAIKVCERALTAIEESNVSGLEDETLSFRTLKARLDDSDSAIVDLYRVGLHRVLRNKGTEAMARLSEVWERRDQIETGAEMYSIVLSAGVGVAAHLAFADEKATADQREVLETIEPYHERLSRPAAILYEHLTAGPTETDPETLASEYVDLEEDQVSAELSLEELEALAYAHLLGALQS